MTKLLVFFLIPVAVAVVAVILVMGLVNMARGGSPQTSQRLMQYRVVMQAVALGIVMLTLWLVGT